MRAAAFRRAGAAGFALAVFTACGGSDSTADSSPSDQNGAPGHRPITITMYTRSPSTRMFIPVLRGGPHMRMIFSPLFRWTREGEIEGDLVRSWEVGDDSGTWTYHLRTDVRWHDGTPLTARDVAFTIELYQDPGVLGHPPGSAVPTVVDDSTVVVRYLRSGWDPLETNSPILPAHLVEGLDSADYPSWEFWEAPAGTGPFRFVRQTELSFVELEANPRHHRGRPAIDRVLLRGGGGGYVELLAGNVDVLPMNSNSISVVQARLLEEDPRFAVYFDLSTGPIRIHWNLSDPLFEDARVRRALSVGIDRRELATFLGYPNELEPRDMPASRGQVLRGETPPLLEYDPSEAARSLEGLGWRDRGGIRERNGSTFEFELLVNPANLPLAVLVQAQLQRIGIRAELTTLDRSLAQRRFQSGDFQAALGLHMGLDNLTFRSGGGRSWSTYESPEMEAIVEALEREVIPSSRDSLYRVLWPLLREGVPLTYLVPELLISAARAEVRGLETPNRSWPEAYLDELWIEGGPDD